MSRPLLHVVDGSGYVFRAYYAIRGVSAPDGSPVNAVYGFAQMLLKALADERPRHIAMVFDPEGPSFRSKIYPPYKANRPPPPADLPPQIPRIREVAATFRLPTFVIDGWEADDVIATITREAVAAGFDVRIITADKDLMQLVSEHVSLYDPMKDKRSGRAEVIERFGVPPERVVELLALAGDSTDNVPGVRGVGEKTAAKLLVEHGSLEQAIEAAKAGRVKGKLGETLARSLEELELSRRLVTLDDHVPIEFSADALLWQGPDYRAQLALFEALDFKRLMPRVAEQAPPPPPPSEPLSRDGYALVLDRASLDAMVAELAGAERIALWLEAIGEHSDSAELLGVALSGKGSKSYYVPLAHTYLGAPRQLGAEELARALAPLLSDPARPKVGMGLKLAWGWAARHGVELAGVVGDGELASYLLEPDDGPHDPAKVAERFLGAALADRDAVMGRGRHKRSFGELTVEEALPLAAERADVAFRAAPRWKKSLEDADLSALMSDLELPLSPVLARVERAGVKIDVAKLAEMGGVFEAELAKLEQACFEAAGQSFNLGSPKQLQKVLFEDLGLKITKRTKTGPSTDAAALEAIADEHPLPQAILEHRQIQKLKSTYVDALPRLVSPTTGRVHTVLNQAVAATGRLSSTDPNLQNIPIRTELGRELRKAFIAEEGARLISVDYSQIELRVLAHVSRDPVLSDAFLRGIDVHRRTASALFDVPLEEVTPDQRAKAKTVNFGVLYGMGPVALARRLGIARKDGQRFIDEYFARQPGVKRYIEETLEAARKEGFVRTLLGRRRRVAELGSQNRGSRLAAERVAVNTPIQGTAADLIKLAMLRVDARLQDEPGLGARLILQVHDELLLEAPAERAEEVARLVKREMERAYPLDVPLVADVHWGRSWAEAH